MMGGAPVNEIREVFAEKWWQFLRDQSKWEDGFCDLLRDGDDYHHMSTDDYDMSVEIKQATDDLRLSAEMQQYLWDAGFGKVYVNHKDGWETHYSFFRETPPVRGWRRRYVSDTSADTTRVIAGPDDPGYWEISYWPEGWDSPSAKKGLTSGYYRIVPDPLDKFNPAAPAKAIEAQSASLR